LTLDVDIGERYTEYSLAKVTGWTLEYIRDLGFLDRELFFQIHEAVSAIPKPGRKTKTWQ
jgi:hypothetical protein